MLPDLRLQHDNLCRNPDARKIKRPVTALTEEKRCRCLSAIHNFDAGEHLDPSCADRRPRKLQLFSHNHNPVIKGKKILGMLLERRKHAFIHFRLNRKIGPDIRFEQPGVVLFVKGTKHFAGQQTECRVIRRLFIGIKNAGKRFSAFAGKINVDRIALFTLKCHTRKTKQIHHFERNQLSGNFLRLIADVLHQTICHDPDPDLVQPFPARLDESRERRGPAARRDFLRECPVNTGSQKQKALGCRPLRFVCLNLKHFA